MKKPNILPFALMLLMLFPMVGEAQNGFNIPYSQFGIGLSDLPYNMPSAYSMGGVSYSRASKNMVNPFNPASYATVEPQSFVFDIGINIQSSTLRQGDKSLSDADGTVAYLAIAFPLTKWWKTSFGLMPYSQVDYESVENHADVLTGTPVKTIYAGNGGVSQIYWGNGFNIGKRLSLGFNVNYLYGSITRAITYDFQNGDTAFYMNSRRQKDTYISSLLFDFGLQYRQPLGEKYSLNLGLTLRTPRSNMTAREEALVYTFVTNGNSEYLVDTIFPAAGKENSYESTLEQPLAVGFGLALERNNRWQVALDGYYSAMSGLKYTENIDYNIFGSNSLQYGPNWRIALGVEWMGDADASSYWARIGVRGGIYYNSGRLNLSLNSSDYQLNEFGGGLGIALPMRKGQSVLNISVGYSRFGNIDLLQRDCFTMGISVGSCERWFGKRKYN